MRKSCANKYVKKFNVGERKGAASIYVKTTSRFCAERDGLFSVPGFEVRRVQLKI